MLALRLAILGGIVATGDVGVCDPDSLCLQTFDQTGLRSSNDLARLFGAGCDIDRQSSITTKKIDIELSKMGRF